jgi:hypothetical protein
LDAICLKAMEKLPENRYQGANEFADDLCRWLDGEPVAAEKPTLGAKIRWWTVRHRAWMGGAAGALVLAILLSWGGMWLGKQTAGNVGQNQSNAVENVDSEQESPDEFKKPIRIETSRSLHVWEKRQYTGELSLTCQVKSSESEEHHMVTIYAPNDDPWDLTGRFFLTFSLLEVHSGSSTSLKNISIWLGCEDSYYEYKPSESLWGHRDHENWSHFTIPLQGHPDDWRREIIGQPAIKRIEWIKIHAETDAEITLLFDNIKFRGE